jgi:hypothetical protein
MGASVNVVPMTLFGNEVEVEYYYYPGEPEVHTESNGDPGTPGTAPSAEMIRIWCELENDEGSSSIVDVLGLIDPEFLSDEIIEKYHE